MASRGRNRRSRPPPRRDPRLAAPRLSRGHLPHRSKESKRDSFIECETHRGFHTSLGRGNPCTLVLRQRCGLRPVRRSEGKIISPKLGRSVLRDFDSRLAGTHTGVRIPISSRVPSAPFASSRANPKDPASEIHCGFRFRCFLCKPDVGVALMHESAARGAYPSSSV